MRWPIDPPPPPKPGAIRTRRVFAWRRTPVRGFIVWLERFELHECFVQPEPPSPGYWREINRDLYDTYCC